MASLEGFETTLKEVVHAKRLSASKIEKLTELALKLMEHDTQLVSILYRTHKSSSAASKINSLYAFDALARAARNQVAKQNVDVHAIVGNCATFLIKVEGVLEGLFQDVLSSGPREAKEKTKKILDIWLKSNTFPSAVLTRLHKLVKEAGTDKGKEPDKATALAADPRTHAAAPSTTTPPQAIPPTAAPEQTAESLQSTLLALLSQAATAAASSQSATNISSTPSMSALQTDPVQLALFQQLAQATKAGGYAPTAVPNQRVPVSMSVVPPSAPANVPVASSVGGPSQNFPYPDDRHGFGRREPLNDRFNGPPRGRESYYDNREQRGGFRGAPRGRGRGRWDDRDRQYDRNRGPDWRPPPPGRNMQSRSRSPVGRNGRNVRPYSPPRNHQAHYPPAPSSPGNVPPANGPAGEKDEFGRDIRPRSPLEHSPAPSSRAPDLSPSRSASIPTEDRGSALPERRQHDAGSSSTTQHTIPPTAMSTSSSSTSSATPAVGLESFDLTKFDPTAPTSWEGLGKAWSVTHGYMPSQEELMQYVMTMNAAATFPIVSQYEEAPARQWQGDNWGRGEPRRGGRSRGYRGSFARGQDYGNGRGGFRGRGRQYEEDTDALTLVGGDDSTQYTVPISDQPQGQGSHDNPEAYEDPTFDSDEKSGGHMEKVGDGWVWKEAAGVA